MDTHGKHLILDIWLEEEIEFLKLKNIIANLLLRHKQMIVGFSSWDFYPGGNSAVFLLAASHASIHTYPEHKYLSFDLYSCDKKLDIKRFKIDILKEMKCINKSQSKILLRGYK